MGKKTKAQRTKERRAQAEKRALSTAEKLKQPEKLTQAEDLAPSIIERNEKDPKKREPQTGVAPKPFTPRPSAAEAEWKRQKEVDMAPDESSKDESSKDETSKDESCKYEPLDKLMKMTGLEQVKETFLTMLAKAHACEQQGVTLEKERFHAIFQGNPGTGLLAQPNT